MNNLLLRYVLALGFVLLACDMVQNDEFDPTGTQFNLNSNIQVIAITGDPGLSDKGPVTMAMTVVSRTSSVETDVLPAGLLLRRRNNQTQHVLFLKDQRVAAGASTTKARLGTFCCNKRRSIPDLADTFDLGPITDNPELRQLAGLVKTKDISRAADMAMVQHAVQMVTDSTGLTQAYLDSINALPPDTTD